MVILKCNTRLHHSDLFDTLLFTAAKKDPSPSLSDPVYKLKEIAENGKRRKLLEQKGIETVQNFLWSYNKDKNNLRKV